MLMTQRLSVMVMEVHEPQLDWEPEAGTFARSWNEYFLLGWAERQRLKSNG